MKTFKNVLPRALAGVIIFTIICGVLYTAIATGLSMLIAPNKANGSIIEVDGVKYGSELVGQQFTDEKHMWGRIVNVDISNYTNEDGEIAVYGSASNKSPASDEYKEMVAERVEMIRAAHPEKGEEPIPVDLVTCSGSGVDPQISVAAAEYQVERLAKNNNMTTDEVQKIIDACTKGRFLGVLGEETVNVLKVNLMLDGILPVEE